MTYEHALSTLGVRNSVTSLCVEAKLVNQKHANSDCHPGLHQMTDILGFTIISGVTKIRNFAAQICTEESGSRGLFLCSLSVLQFSHDCNVYRSFAASTCISTARLASSRGTPHVNGFSFGGNNIKEQQATSSSSSSYSNNIFSRSYRAPAANNNNNIKSSLFHRPVPRPSPRIDIKSKSLLSVFGILQPAADSEEFSADGGYNFPPAASMAAIESAGEHSPFLTPRTAGEK
jgi:hypothetical protein